MKKILVVDDEPDITTSIKNGLQRKGFEVDIYNDPTDALSNFKPDIYDLLLIDIRMPKMNGFELYREVKKKSNNVRICFFTAFEVYYDEFRKMFPNLEVKCFIRKPITISDLVTHINSELEK
ncbi:putative signal transduction response regulator [Nitrosotalea devaniterrae]|uniref:Putative signal transduction response regulator n=1 Tax=Nitrosotalea devaniterrae TaxID=1078905 RepID=A0A128A4I6_9ARCH|nr:putative signal transduction response regulator [Candidatus Nitrosotalea devanaterra]